ncbi:MAG TPA: acyl-CoA desaturase [Steroidobacteraceae bacterium]|nr:acyl-CoA desaturase [Steroidobacteraceae bacterium]
MTARAARSRLKAALLAWVDSTAASPVPAEAGRRVDWLRVVPFIALHLACLLVVWVGCSPIAVTVAAALYALRMFAITAFYHRYFSHKAFRTSRAMQFLFAVLGASAVQRGPLWWASQHRHHHAHSDDKHDAHSPHRHGFLWAHSGWFMAPENFPTRSNLVRDLAKYPELRFLDRYDSLVPFLLAVLLYLGGEGLAATDPALGTNGLQLLIWGFCISTVVLAHATFTVNSLAHTVGTRRYPTRDSSRNNWWLALLTFGEGWHNNHHHYPGAARQGFFWWELDLTWYGLKLLAALGLVWDLRPVPASVRRLGTHA